VNGHRGSVRHPVSTVLGSVCVAVLVALTAAPAGATPANDAKTLAEQRITAFMPASPGANSVCQVRTTSGFFNKKHSYLASCSTSADSFQYFFIANARRGPLDVKSPYLSAQIGRFCNNGGYVFATGVKGDFLAVFAEAAVPGSTHPGGMAQGLRDSLDASLKKLKGYKAVDVCRPG
jgi:hypothetical protein